MCSTSESVNIASGSVANIITLCEIKNFNFLYISYLGPHRVIDPLDPVATPRVGCKFWCTSQPQVSSPDRDFNKNLNLAWFGLIQGPSWQSVYSKLALTDRNMQFKFCLKVSVYS